MCSATCSSCGITKQNR
uniref:Uncharacterized protein n=1 Tax=Arundo donax TaxID=35708 RepID=A0A0A9FLP5_ARUDO